MVRWDPLDVTISVQLAGSLNTRRFCEIQAPKATGGFEPHPSETYEVNWGDESPNGNIKKNSSKLPTKQVRANSKMSICHSIAMVCKASLVPVFKRKIKYISRALLNINPSTEEFSFTAGLQV